MRFHAIDRSDPEGLARLIGHGANLGPRGHGFVLAIGRGNEVQTGPIAALADHILGRDVHELQLLVATRAASFLARGTASSRSTISALAAPADALAIISALEDHFFPVTTLTDVISLYDFDVRLRTATFDALGPVELSLWALHGHELGEVDECAHLKLDLLSPRAKGKPYEIWLEKYTKKLGRSHEDCVSHHQDNYDGVLPVWAAVEIVDFGQLTLIQHMRDMHGVGRSRVLSAMLASYPSVKLVPTSHVGVPPDWANSRLWAR